MKLLTRSMAAALIIWAQTGLASAYYATKDEMVAMSKATPIIDVVDVKKEKNRTHDEDYNQRVFARVGGEDFMEQMKTGF